MMYGFFLMGKGMRVYLWSVYRLHSVEAAVFASLL